MRTAAQLSTGERNDILQAIRASASLGSKVLLAMVHTKAKQYRVQEDTIRLVVMTAAMLVQGEQLKLAKSTIPSEWNWSEL